MKKLIALSMIVLITGCASQWKAERQKIVQNSLSQFNNSVGCCESFKDLHYDEFDDSFNKRSLKENSRFANFPEGKSFYHASKLPTFNSPQKLRIKSYYQGDSGFTPAQAILYPLITFLDKDFSVVETIKPTNLIDHGGFFEDLDAGAFAIVDLPENSKFIVVRTAQSFLGQSFNFSRSGGGTMIGSSYISGGSYQFSVPFIPTGEISLKLLKEKKTKSKS